MDKNDVVIVGAVRTPFGRFDGILRTVPSLDLGVMVLKEAAARIGLDPREVDEVYYGTCIPAEYAVFLNVPARQVTLGAGFPVENVSLTIDRACCSSMTALRLGYRAVKAGEARVVVAAGAENMGNTALIARAEKVRWGSRLGPVELEDILYELGYGRRGFAPVAADAGHVALEYGVSREEQDEWAVRSHQKWLSAYRAGKYRVGGELMAIEVPGGRGQRVVMEKDESPREDVSPAKLAALKTVYGSPTVTAGNAPGLNSGAAAVVLMAREKAAALGLTPLATVEACQAAAGEPKYMACVPAQTMGRLLDRTGMRIEDMDVVEINEAFAAVTLVSLKMLAGGDPQRLHALQAKTNVGGGAIAIGHPVGASGARIVTTMMYELRRRGGGRGIAGICGGLSQGEALMISV